MTTALKAVGATTLPRKALPTDTVTIDGAEVPVRGLSRAEALHLNTAFRNDTPTGDVAGAEVYILVHGAGVTDAEASAFREEVDPDTAGLLIDRILELSGLTNAQINGKVTDPKPTGNGPS